MKRGTFWQRHRATLILTLIFLLAGLWMWQRERVMHEEKRLHYLGFMKDAWGFAPRAVADLESLHALLDDLRQETNETILQEELFEHARFLDARLRQTAELLRRMDNLFPIREQQEMHARFRQFLAELQMAEEALRRVIGSPMEAQSLAAASAIREARQALSLVPDPDEWTNP